ncbi:MAG: hypothetical protein AAGA02_03180 [Bacteroidota bacterium]
MHLKLKWNKLITLFIFTSFINYSLTAQDTLQIYSTSGTDSTLTTPFVKALCQSVITRARYKGKFELENLIVEAAANERPDSLKTVKWHSKYGNECMCPATEDFEQMNFLRLIVLSNFRDFANLIGPGNRVALDFNLLDSSDSLNIYDFVNTLRKSIESSYDDKRFEFQQDERWKNVMFFYFLFSEFYLKQH